MTGQANWRRRPLPSPILTPLAVRETPRRRRASGPVREAGWLAGDVRTATGVCMNPPSNRLVWHQPSRRPPARSGWRRDDTAKQGSQESIILGTIFCFKGQTACLPEEQLTRGKLALRRQKLELELPEASCGYGRQLPLAPSCSWAIEVHQPSTSSPPMGGDPPRPEGRI